MTNEPVCGSMCPSTGVIYRVAALEDTEPTALPPLYEAVDGDALDALVESTSKSDPSNFHIKFPYNGHQITVTTNGVIHIDSDTAD